jgi:choline-sulfatase
MTRRVHALHAIAAIALFASAFAVAQSAKRVFGVDLMDWIACSCSRRECLTQFGVSFAFAAAGTLGLESFLRRPLRVPGAIAIAGAAFWAVSAVHASSAAFGPPSLATFLLLPLVALFASEAPTSASARYALAWLLPISAIHGGGQAASVFFATALGCVLSTGGSWRTKREALALLVFAFAASAFAWMPDVLDHRIFASRGAFLLDYRDLGAVLLSRMPSVSLARLPGGFPRHVAFVGWPLLVLAAFGTGRLWRARSGSGVWLLILGAGGLLLVPMSFSASEPLVAHAALRFPLVLGLCVAAALGLHRSLTLVAYDSRVLAQRQFLALFVFTAASIPVADAMLFSNELIETRATNLAAVSAPTCTPTPSFSSVRPFMSHTSRLRTRSTSMATSAAGLVGLFVFAFVSQRSARRARREFEAHLRLSPRTPLARNAATTSSSNLPLYRATRAWLTERFSPSLARSLVVGLIAAEMLAFTDVFVGVVRPRGQNSSIDDVIVSALHLLAFYAPVGWLVGVAFHVSELSRLALVRRLPSESERTSTAADRRAASSALTVVVLAALATLGVTLATQFVLSKIHRATLVPVAIGLAALAIAGSAALAFPIARAIVDALIKAFIPKLNVRVAALAALIAAPFGIAPVVLSVDVAWSSFDLVALAFPVVLILYAYGVAHLTVLRERHSNGVAKAVRYALPFLAAATVLALIASAATFGTRFGARAFVEERSVAGRKLLRAYSNLADVDRDGYAFAFGGGDCDDNDAEVHPTAYDRPGDGVDTDCFGGDGSREVDSLSDGDYAPMPHRARPFNILLVTIDALRPDALGTYHAERDTSPHLDRFAETAVVFERAIAQAPRSLRSITSFFTGLYPSQIAYGPELLWPSFKPENVSLAEALRDGGYQTSAVVGTSYFHAFSGFFQGFEKVDEASGFHASRTWTFDHAAAELARLRTAPAPWFLWAHSLNVHDPYLPDRHESLYGPGKRAAYDTEIRLMDAQLEKLLAALRESGQYENTVVVIASDHGEAFGEHGFFTHGHSLYDEELRATFIMRVPGVAPRRIRETIPLFDLTPTLLNLAGIPMPAPTPSRSLVSVMQGTSAMDPQRLVFSELAPDGVEPFDLKSVRRGRHTLIWSVRDGSFRLYDHHADPLQATNLADDETELRTELEHIVRSWAATRARPSAAKGALIAASLIEAFPRTITERFDARHGGDLLFVGYDLPTRTFSVGDTIPLVLYHEALGAIDDDYMFHIAFKPTTSVRVPASFHGSHRPVNGHFPTREWRRGMKIRDAVPVVIPDDIRRPLVLDIELYVTVNERRVAFATPSGPRSEFFLGRIEIR